MSRSNDHHPRVVETQLQRWRFDLWKYKETYQFLSGWVYGRRPYMRKFPIPRDVWRYYRGHHPSWQAKLWRQKFRNAANRALREAKDWDEAQIPRHIWEETSWYDWY